MNRHGYSGSEWRTLTGLMETSHRLRVRASLLNLDRRFLANLTPILLDGQIDIDGAAEVTRRATVVLYDPRRALPFDSDSPADGALWFDRMIRLVYEVWNPDTTEWMGLVPFTGPVVGLARDGRQVTVTCDGMERLALGQCWAPLALDKGMRKTDAIRRIMRERAGETRFDIPDHPATLPHALTLTPDDVPWTEARKLARSMDRQLYYTGDGVCTLRKRPTQVVFVFTGRRHVLTPPRVVAPSDFANAVRVVGADPKGPKKHVHAQAVAAGRLNPGRLGRTGSDDIVVGRFVMPGGQTIRDGKLKTRSEARARANRVLDDALRQPVQVEFDALPGPGAFLDPGDMCRVTVDEGVVTFRYQRASVPLSAASGQGMTVGYNDPRLARSTTRRPRRHPRRRHRAGR